ncbi:MAG: ABC transporter substrate-binding protein [Proteobacteria bacterium]|nr:ABC transporter substrate-binding protein [Pseudomonadota bacterium]
MRIVSLLPAATEIVCALGARDQLVGVSHECDYPPGVETLAVLTRARVAPVGSSRDIDRAVRDIVRDALAVYDVDTAELGRVAPDVVVTQDLCDVCAVSIGDVRSALSSLALRDVQIVSLSPTRLADIWSDIARVADGTGRAEAGRAVIARLQARVDAIARRASAIASRPRVLAIEWIDPVMIGGMWMPELIALAAGQCLQTEPGQHAPTLSRDDLAKLDPDVILVKPCGFTLERTQGELAALRAALPWQSWRAVAEQRVYLADGNAYFNRPGPRIVESLEILAGCLHPGEFSDFLHVHRGSVMGLNPDLSLRPLA